MGTVITKFSAMKIRKPISFLILACGLPLFLARPASGQEDAFNLRVIKNHVFAQHLYRDKLLQDPYRPVYHFVVPEGLAHPHDPNGAFYWKGRYHLFYIFQTVEPLPYYRGDAWAHISSHDLLHWRFHPTALKPDEESPERAIYSGNMFLDHAGVPTIMYHGLGAGNSIARSAGDHMLETWIKDPGNPVIPYPEFLLDKDEAEYRTILESFPEYGAHDVWDPHCWLEDGTYYSISGNNSLWPGREALYKSDDLKSWELLGDFFHHDPVEDVLDCPDFFPLGDKHVLLYLRNGLEYVIGEFREEQFHPENHGTMSWNLGAAYAPESLIDDRGRRIMWAALHDSRTRWGDLDGFIMEHGWCGTLSLPRVLSLDEKDRLRIEPVEELRSLRHGHSFLENLEVVGEDMLLEGIQGNVLEVRMEIDPGKATEVGVKVCASPDGKEETVISFLPEEEKMKVDLSRTSLDPILMEAFYDEETLQLADLSLDRGEFLDLHIFIDRSVLEVFVNSRLCLTHRIYPTREDSRGVKIFSRGGSCRVKRIDAWKLFPSNPF
jgi:sucrose-6-phosphate hydrolase SacC (GH32 family)